MKGLTADAVPRVLGQHRPAIPADTPVAISLTADRAHGRAAGAQRRHHSRLQPDRGCGPSAEHVEGDQRDQRDHGQDTRRSPARRR